MMQMMKLMNFVMGNVCDRLDRVKIHSNEADTSTQDVRKVGAEPKANSGSRAERARWADYEDFKEDIDDIGDGGFEDEVIGHQQGFRHPRNRRDFRNRTRSQFGQRGNLRSVGGHDDSYLEAKKMEDDIHSMRQQISGADRRKFTISKKEKPRFQVSNIYTRNAFMMLDKKRKAERLAKVYKETNKEREELLL
jgi:hypothetical protein